MAATNEPDSEPTQPWDGASGGMPASPISDSGLEGLLGANAPVTRGGWQPPSPEELQARLPHYEVTELLGRGGMGAVYKGWQKSLERFVAIKILPPGLESGDVDFAARFKREAKAMAKLKHPGIIPVHDAGETADGLLYFVMDFVEGTDVQKLLAARGKLPPEEALPIASRVLDALAYAHQRGIIHRDIKPANIMLDTDGNVLVADFGLARSTAPDTTMLTVSNMAMGTPDFMAPESHLGMDHVDHRADLYAVGVMLYQMLTGKLPRGRFESPSHAVPGLDKRLDAIVDRTLQNERDARYSSAIELKSAIEPVLARSIAKRQVVTRSPRPRETKGWLIGAAVIVPLALGIGFLWPKIRTGSRPAATAELSEAAGANSLATWRDAFAEPPLNVVIARLPKNPGGYALPRGNHWQFPAVALQSGALRWRGQASQNWPTLLVSASDQHQFLLGVSDPGQRAYIAEKQQTKTKTLAEASEPVAIAPQAGGVGEMILMRLGGKLRLILNGRMAVEADDPLAGAVRLGLIQRPEADFKTQVLEYINLDGLPEAEARQLAGLDERTALPPWRDAMAEGLLQKMIASADRSPQGYLLPAGQHWRFPEQPLGAGAIRVRATVGAAPFLQLCLYRGDASAAHDRVSISDDLKTVTLKHSAKPGTNTEEVLATAPVQLTPGQAQEFMLVRIGGQLWVFIDGQVRMAARTPDTTPGRFGIACPKEAWDIRLLKAEYLHLDGLSEAEARKLIGLDKP